MKKALTNAAIIRESKKAKDLLKQCMGLLETHHVPSPMRIAAELNNHLVNIVLQRKRYMKFKTLEEACGGLLPEGIPHSFTKAEVEESAQDERKPLVSRCRG